MAIFAGTNREPDLLPLIARYPEVLWSLPKVTGPGEMKFLRVNETSSLSPGAYGILESDTGEIEEEIEIFLCPGVAFTEQGRRLGQGGGFYDRYLSRFPDAGKIGICFREQLLDDLPGEDHDIQMDRVITSSAAPSV